MTTIELKAETREIFGKKVKTLRQAGLIPAEVYGREIKNLSIQIPIQDLKHALGEAGGTNLISIKIAGKKPIPTLARNVQYSPTKRHLLHVDFYAVVMTDKVSVSVPIELIGETDLVNQEGTLMTGLTSLEIEALPGDIPEVIKVDISPLKEFSDAIHVADLSLPEGVTIQSSLDSMIVTVQPPRTIEEVEEEEEIYEEELPEPEVITASKRREEEEE